LLSISIIFIFARDNWRHRHNPSERELVFLVYLVDTPKEFHLLIYTYFTLLLTRSSVIINRLAVETFSLVLACSEIILCS
jgi:hypothetical protein